MSMRKKKGGGGGKQNVFVCVRGVGGIQRTERAPTLLDLQQATTLSPIVYPPPPPSCPVRLPESGASLRNPGSPVPSLPRGPSPLQAISNGVETILGHNGHSLNRASACHRCSVTSRWGAN